MVIIDNENDLSSYIIIHDTMNNNTLKVKRTPHEQIFINLLLKKHLIEKETSLKFIAFVDQYFPKYL